ncbi:dynein regulatory complex protein 9 isoform X2 [Siniperca chuatsi]|uniref:dynein regulatory complex protein 9 isoform X2 n=1 Tax=Siniperca chuatsi TaxID=119488 RepID=UPI001CE16F97|nr:dynein regulatory complex protein 9 isoform X2 [Siniperca chuatsi]
MSLSRIQSLRLAAALEDCSDQLDILGHTLTVQISRERDTAAAQEKARLTKLRRDCQYISQQVFKLHLELEEKQSFSSLQQAVEEAGQKKKAENMRREAKRELAQRRQTVQRQQEEHQRKTEKLKDMYWLAKGLKHQLNEESSKIATKKKIVEKNTKLLQKQLKEETRVHEKSKTFLQNQHKELQQQLQQWQQRTKQMLQEKEQQLNSVRCKRTVNLDRLVEMRRKFKEMEQVVMEDREEQEKLCQQQAEARAATKLQAWWRGCMVRRGLGSFKKAEVVKKGKKKKEGKKKKKK